MFCSNCGNNVENDSVFCPHCGKPLTGSANTASKGGVISINTGSFDFAELGKFLLSLFKKPVETMGNLGALSDISAWILSALVSIATVVEVFIIKGILMSEISSTLGAFVGYGSFDIFEGQNAKLFFGIFIDIALVLACSALVVFLFCKFVFKNNDYKYVDAVKIVVTAYTYCAVLTMIGGFVAFISTNLGILIISLASIAYAVLLVKGIFNQGLCEESTALYVSFAIYVTTALVNYIVITNLIKSIFKSMMGGMF